MSKATFEGFEAPNTTPVPDIVFDKLLAELTGNELKVLLYIIRRTYGFGKSADAISLSQFREGITTKKDEKVLDKGCGIKHNRTILVALASLEKKGYVIANKRQTTIGDADTTIYKLRFKESPQAALSGGVVTSGNHVVTPRHDGSLSQVTTGSYSTSRRVVTSGNPQETVLQETVKQETEEQERESPPNTLDTHTIVSSDTAHADTHSHCFFCSEEAELTCQVCGKRVCYYTHGRRFPLTETVNEDYCLDCLDAHNASVVFTNNEPQGDTHAPAASEHPHRVGDVAARGGDSGHTAMDNGQVATPEGRPILEAQEITEGEHHATRVPTVPRADHPASLERHASGHPQSDNHCAVGRHDDLPVVHPVGRGTPGPEDRAGRAQDGSVDKKDAAKTLTETPPTSTPAQSLPLPQDAQAALGAAQSAHGTHRTASQAQPQGADSAKWNAQAMVARACELRGKPFSDTARPKETKAAQKLFDRKPDLAEEEFERAFQQWNTQWWRDTNGLFNLTDLAAVPKNKSEMRLIIALEKLALSKAITRQSGQIIPISGTKRYSSYDDPNFSSENDFYPVEGGSYAAASI